MDNTDHIKSHDKFASTYDSQVKQYNSYGSELLFGMCYEYINKIAQTLRLTIQKEQKILVNSGDKDTNDILFKVIVMQK